MNKAIYGTLVGLILLGTFFLGRLSSASNLAARCAVTIPAEWGDYAGANQYGIVFKDSDGTLRVVKNVDMVAQWMLFQRVLFSAAILVGVMLVGLPYVAARGLTNRILHRRYKREVAPGSAPAGR
jgi:hypothetical protein